MNTAPRCAACHHSFEAHDPEALACAGCGERPCGFVHRLPRTGSDALRQDRALEERAWAMRIACVTDAEIARRLRLRGPGEARHLVRLAARRRPLPGQAEALAVELERLGILLRAVRDPQGETL